MKPTSNMTYHLVTLGCQMNKSDSERVRTVMYQLGYTWADDEDSAGLIGILACSVRQKAIDKVYSRIHKWNTWKKNRNLLTFLTGCVLPSDKEKLLKLFDFVFPIEELQDFENLIRHYGVVTPVSLNPGIKEDRIDIPYLNSTMTDISPKKARKQSLINLGNFWKIDPDYFSDFEAFVPIQNGCDKFCTFCAVPYTRGREVSRPSQEILEEINQLLQRDYKSITLLGQNVNSYGRDKKGTEISFQELLDRIGQLCDNSGKEVWVYFTSPHPRDMTEAVIKVIRRHKSLAKQIHLPLQSGDDELLISMNRKHSVDKYRKIILAVRRHLPDATIFTDIIVGFTGETNKQFENTRKIMEEIMFNMAYIAMYSPRPGAASSKWTDDIPQEVKKERLFILSEELKEYSSKYNKRMIGQTHRVLVTGCNRKDGFLSGYTEGKIIVRFPSDNLDLIGKFVDITISSAADFSVEGFLSAIKKAEMIYR
jgi:tRNA-2-methylthio-N6-dimethylallyladenosine synthase